MIGKNKKNKKNRQQGITLIEMIVALFVFSIVMSLTTDLFITGLKAQRRALALQYIQNNARYALELMSKEIRMSHIESDSSQGYLHITTYKPDGPRDVKYTILNDKITRNGESLMSDKVKVNYLNFYIVNQNDPPALVTVAFDIETVGSKVEEQSVKQFQTSISTRDYEE